MRYFLFSEGDIEQVVEAVVFANGLERSLWVEKDRFSSWSLVFAHYRQGYSDTIARRLADHSCWAETNQLRRRAVYPRRANLCPLYGVLDKSEVLLQGLVLPRASGMRCRRFNRWSSIGVYLCGANRSAFMLNGCRETISGP